MNLTWYNTLVRPALTPPSAVFGPVWTILYILMGVAFILVLRAKVHRGLKRRAVILFLIQLALNLVWSPIFFTLHRIDLALVDIIALWALIVFTIVYFYKVSKASAWLLAPYLLWVSFATYLNFALWILNP